MTTAPSDAPAPQVLRIRRGEFETAYLDSGRGSPVVLIHGSGPGVSGRANWQGTMSCSSLLAGRHRLIAPDVVGFGQTSAEPGVSLDHEARVRQLIGFLEACELGPVDLVGNSMGGGLALAIAHRRPDLVRRMVLMGSVGIRFPISPGLDRVWGYTPSLANMAELVGLFAHDPGLMTDELIRLRYEASTVPGVQERYAEAFAAPRQRHVDAMALTDEQLGEIQTPTLLLHGAQDAVIPVESTSLELVRRLPNADLVVFGRCGHWTQIERAPAFQRALRDFFAD
jgi:pimeloyl-ACP methyl ester carboxylesterase